MSNARHNENEGEFFGLLSDYCTFPYNTATDGHHAFWGKVVTQDIQISELDFDKLPSDVYRRIINEYKLHLKFDIPEIVSKYQTDRGFRQALLKSIGLQNNSLETLIFRLVKYCCNSMTDVKNIIEGFQAEPISSSVLEECCNLINTKDDARIFQEYYTKIKDDRKVPIFIKYVQSCINNNNIPFSSYNHISCQDWRINDIFVEAVKKKDNNLYLQLQNIFFSAEQDALQSGRSIIQGMEPKEGYTTEDLKKMHKAIVTCNFQIDCKKLLEIAKSINNNTDDPNLACLSNFIEYIKNYTININNPSQREIRGLEQAILNNPSQREIRGLEQAIRDLELKSQSIKSSKLHNYLSDEKFKNSMGKIISGIKIKQRPPLKTSILTDTDLKNIILFSQGVNQYEPASRYWNYKFVMQEVIRGLFDNKRNLFDDGYKPSLPVVQNEQEQSFMQNFIRSSEKIKKPLFKLLMVYQIDQQGGQEECGMSFDINKAIQGVKEKIYKMLIEDFNKIASNVFLIEGMSKAEVEDVFPHVPWLITAGNLLSYPQDQDIYNALLKGALFSEPEEEFRKFDIELYEAAISLIRDPLDRNSVRHNFIRIMENNELSNEQKIKALKEISIQQHTGSSLPQNFNLEARLLDPQNEGKELSENPEMSFSEKSYEELIPRKEPQSFDEYFKNSLENPKMSFSEKSSEEGVIPPRQNSEELLPRKEPQSFDEYPNDFFENFAILENSKMSSVPSEKSYEEGAILPLEETQSLPKFKPSDEHFENFLDLKQSLQNSEMSLVRSEESSEELLPRKEPQSLPEFKPSDKQYILQSLPEFKPSDQQDIKDIKDIIDKLKKFLIIESGNNGVYKIKRGQTKALQNFLNRELKSAEMDSLGSIKKKNFLFHNLFEVNSIHRDTIKLESIEEKKTSPDSSQRKNKSKGVGCCGLFSSKKPKKEHPKKLQCLPNTRGNVVVR
jgi:hypothetical protein